MTEYEELMSRLTEMRSRYGSGFSSSDRNYITLLYGKLLSKTIARVGCRDCYRDAFIEIYTYLKKTGTMPTMPNYILKPGVVVHPKGTNQFYANANIPDKIAEQHLAEFPNSIVDFQSYPSDYLARVEARKNGEEPEAVDTEALKQSYEEAKAKLEQTTKELETANAEIASLKDELKAQSETASTFDEDGSLSIEIETLKADLEAANAEIASLKEQLEKAKSASTSATSKKQSSKSAD